MRLITSFSRNLIEGLKTTHMISLVVIAAIFAWALYGMHVLELHKPALEALNRPVAGWFAEPGNPVKPLLWIGALALSLTSWLSSADTLFNQMLPDFISISIAVIVIDELVAYRTRLERKQEIIEQLHSRVRDVAVEAIRLVQKNDWWKDVDKNALAGVEWAHASLWNADLKGAFLASSNLANADLVGANLKEAILWGANLKDAKFRSANLVRADLQRADLNGADFYRATYSLLTQWPDDFDPVAAGALLVDEEQNE